ncbi:hypothetical protein GCM10009747_27080 [Agromyces humatus]|uniref:Uncharacterized protein n=1 Tax=Agromyces humatus TaxID=279573 RepID=A0ABP4X1F4_9MICO
MSGDRRQGERDTEKDRRRRSGPMGVLRGVHVDDDPPRWYAIAIRAVWNGYAPTRAFVDSPSARVANAGVAGGVAVWDLRPMTHADAACRMAGRDLTPEEWTCGFGND